MGSKQRRLTDRRRRAGQASVARADHLRRIEWAIAIVATAIPLLLHGTFFWHAGALWRDEVNTVNVAAAPSFSAMWRLAEFDSFPILWLLLLRGWIAVGAGATDLGLRLLGLCGGLALVAAVWFAALRLGGRMPLVSLALVAVNPEIVRWGASVRAWGLGASLAIVTLVLIKEASESPMRRGILLAAVAAVLSVQCLFHNAVVLVGIVAGGVATALARGAWRQALVPVGIGVIAAISLLPYAGTIGRVGQWSTLVQIPTTLDDLIEKVSQVMSASGTVVWRCWQMVIAATLVAGFYRSTSRWRGSDHGVRPDAAMYSAVVLTFCSIGFALFLLRVRYLTQPWYYIGVLAVVAVCAEAAIATSLSPRIARITLAAFALVIIIAGLTPAWESLQQRQTNVDGVAARLRAEAGRGDLVLVNPWFYAISLDRYYHGDADVATIPPLDDRTVHRYDLLKRQMLSADPIGPLLVRIRVALESGHGVWLVGGIGAPPSGTAAPRLPFPPLADSGWGVSPYMQTWSLQTGAFLRDHIVEQRPIPIGIGGGPYESPGLVVFHGWRP